jgi:Zn-dependent M16 (insulinase) family peptidase
MFLMSCSNERILISTYIYFGEDTRATAVDVPLYVGGIPTSEVDGFDGRLRGSLKRIADEGIDTERMRMVIDRDERQLRSKLESAKGDTFSGNVIDDVLYGDVDGSLLKDSMDEFGRSEMLKGWTSKQWSALIRQYFLDQPAVIIRGKPSASMAERLEKDEKARLAAQVKKLGDEGLEKAAKLLKDAKEEHELPIPTDILTAFPVPDVHSISWIPVSSVQQPGKGRSAGPPPLGVEAHQLQQIIEKDGEELPFFIEYEHVKVITVPR